MEAEPIVKIEKTVSGGPGWLTSGTVTFNLPGDATASPSLTFQFQHAQTQKAAIQQAAGQLQIVAEAFVLLANRHLR